MRNIFWDTENDILLFIYQERHFRIYLEGQDPAKWIKRFTQKSNKQPKLKETK